ncbi:MAG: extracellular solute-binding protein [Chloroflexi bacterium]|nr:extracellular solute-binding protein [Chloroflexota bacterium]
MRHGAPILIAVAVALALVAGCGAAGPAAAPGQQPAAADKGAAAPAAAAQSAAKPAAPAAATAEDKLAKAKAEGKVIWYSSLAQKDAEQIAKNFEQKTGIKVELNRLSAGAAWDRVYREKRANIDAVDVLDSGGPWYHLQAKQEGLLAKYTPEGVEAIAKDFRDPDGVFTQGWLGEVPLVYNTKNVAAADVPKSYKDAADPKWKGRIAHASPIHSGSALDQAVQLVKLYGWDYYQKLKANDVLIVRSHLAPVELVVSGERHFGVGNTASAAYLAKAQGNPVEIVWPTEGVIPSQISTSIFAKAPHPNAARVFVDYLLSKESLQYLAQQWWTVTHTDVTPPAGKPKVNEIKFYFNDYIQLIKEQEAFKGKLSDLFGG